MLLRTSLFFGLLLPAFLLKAQPCFSTPLTNQTDSCGKRQGHWIITGMMKKDPAYTDSSIVEEGFYTDGKKNGYWYEFYPNGNRKSVIYFINNRPNGPAAIYHRNGKLSETGIWKGTKLISSMTLFSEDETVIKIIRFDQDGRKQTIECHADGSESGTTQPASSEKWTGEYSKCRF